MCDAGYLSLRLSSPAPRRYSAVSVSEVSYQRSPQEQHNSVVSTSHSSFHHYPLPLFHAPFHATHRTLVTDVALGVISKSLLDEALQPLLLRPTLSLLLRKFTHRQPSVNPLQVIVSGKDEVTSMAASDQQQARV